jgi:hypothetical protein
VKNGQAASSMSEQVRRRLNRSELFEFASEKKPRISPRLFSCQALPAASVGTDSDADAGGADADAATFLIAAALDITLATGSISV